MSEEIKLIAIGKLAEKISAASVEVGGKLKADKRNDQGGYDYISADKALSEAGQALARQGISIIPQITAQELNLGQTSKGGVRYDVCLTMLMLVTDGETQVYAPWFGWGSDYTSPDKAAFKAITSGDKYFRMKLLSIGEGNEDGEHQNEPAAKKSNGKPASRIAEPPEPIEPDYDGWNAELVETLAGELNLHPNRMKNTLALSNLDPETTSIGAARLWVSQYKKARSEDMTPQEAATFANGEQVEA